MPPLEIEYHPARDRNAEQAVSDTLNSGIYADYRGIDLYPLQESRKQLKRLDLICHTFFKLH